MGSDGSQFWNPTCRSSIRITIYGTYARCFRHFPSHGTIFSRAISGAAYYTFDALHADTHSGHNVVATVFMECGAFYDPSRGEALKSVGEVEFVNGVAAQGASGLYGDYRPCAAIVGHADLTLGDAVKPVVEALVAAGNGRFKGIRHSAAWDADTDVLGPPVPRARGTVSFGRLPRRLFGIWRL